MNKLLQFLDNHLLKFAVAFSILFITLYPKLPSIQVTHTWVYIRLEDFAIALLTIIWFIQLLRKKVSVPKPEGFVLVLYWIIGLVSLLYCLFFIGSHLANFFPKIAVLEYMRRIEYMILFFVGFSSIKSKKDIRDFIVTISITVSAVCIYGFGQRFYQLLWHAFPKFFEKNPFCFPAFLTGNEEFSKGGGHCLDVASRVASTFGGHYDLAAYLVFVIPVLIAVFLIVKKWYWRVLTAIITLCSIELLNFTSSRTSFAAYVVGIVCMLIFWKRKKWIIPVLFVSVLVSIFFSNSVLQRFAKTIQQVKVVTINTSSNNLPSNLQRIIKKTKEDEENQTPQSPPPGTITTATNNATTSSTVTTVVTDAELRKLEEQDIAISTVSGSFLIQKAYALDISFTTRFQAEWPRDWTAFLKYPLLGQGYSTLTLASDNDYLRALGETGVLGFISFLLIFLSLGIYMKNAIGTVKDDMTQALLFGLAGGIVGLLMNAILIDVFEASKVAEPMWLLLGIGMGGASLYYKKTINYKKELFTFFTSIPMIAVYLWILVMLALFASMHTFFIGDDFTWLHWAAASSLGNIKDYFVNASGFFYRPISKTIILILYTFFSFQPDGYHLFNFFLHFLIAFGIFLLARKIIRNKFFSFLAAVLFIILPANAENIFWISTISTNLATMFSLYAMYAFLRSKEKNSIVLYILSLLFGILALLSYEGAIIIPLLIFLLDSFLNKWKITKKQLLFSVPFLVLSIAYLFVHMLTHAVSAGGDYTYSIPHLIPNVFGNLFGYIGLFIFGQHILPIYTAMRTDLKTYAAFFGIAIIGIGIVALILGYGRRKLLRPFIKNKSVYTILFLLTFIFIALLPFLGLGNIAERYGYMASIGFCMLTSYLLLQIKETYNKDINRYIIYIVGLVFSVVLILNYLVTLHREEQDWQHASAITARTLRYLRIHNPNIPPGSILYFVNPPIRYADAWVFPVGLPNGVWFIYRDDTMKMITVSSIEAAKKKKIENNQSIYIFSFDKNYQISEVK